MRINQNIMAQNAYRNLSSASTQMGKSLEKLSSGFRINRAGDDAAGLVISNRLRAQTSGLRVASRNAQDGISVVQTAESALNEVQNMLNRMRDLSVQSANTGALDANARTAAQAELSELRNEIDRIAKNTSFGTQELLDGSYGVKGATVSSAAAGIAPATFQAVAASDDFDIEINGGPAVTVELGDLTGLDGADAAASVQASINDALGAAGSTYAGKVSVTAKAGTTPANTVFTLTVDGLNDGETFTLTNGTNTPLTALGLGGAVTAADGEGGVFQVGNDVVGAQQIDVQIDDVQIFGGSEDVFTDLATIDVSDDAADAQTKIDAAIDKVSEMRADLGAKQNRFESTIANLDTIVENLSASESRIRDADMALEMSGFTRNQILVQAGTAMLAQANGVSQNVLQLLRG